MKKVLIILGVILIVLLVGAGAAYKLAKHFAPAAVQKVAQQSGVFGSIQDALSKDLTLQCQFTDETGRQTTSYIKHGQVRADIKASDPKQSGSVIVKDKTVYFWNTQMGIKMALPDEAETKELVKNAAPTGTSGSQGADMLAMMEKYKNSCKPAVVDDSLFVVPTTVKFTDLSQMLRPTTSPSGAAPTGMSQEQIQQLMQKYQSK